MFECKDKFYEIFNNMFLMVKSDWKIFSFDFMFQNSEVDTY